MKHVGLRTLQTVAGTVALTLASWALAQTAAPASSPVAGTKPQHSHTPARKAQSASTPQDRETAAAHQAAKQGLLDDGQGPSQYEHNALSRCQVFKTDADRSSCEQRVRNSQVTGSVQGGGTLMEYSEPMPVAK